MNISKLYYFLTAAVFTFACALMFNAFTQSRFHRNNLIQNAQIAVFTAPGANLDIVGEKLNNLDGVYQVELFSSDKVLQKAVNDLPALKDIMIPETNPFAPYFLVYPENIEAPAYANLKNEILKLEAVEDAKYDQNIPEISDGLKQFSAFYKYSIKLILVFMAVLALFKLAFRWFSKSIDVMGYIYNVLIGIAAGLAGTALYFFLGHYVMPSSLISLLSSQIIYLISGAILIILAMES